MSGLQGFRVWVQASRQRHALLFASWLAVWVTAIEAVRHKDPNTLAHLGNVALPTFVICYLVRLLMLLPSRSKRPS